MIELPVKEKWPTKNQMVILNLQILTTNCCVHIIIWEFMSRIQKKNRFYSMQESQEDSSHSEYHAMIKKTKSFQKNLSYRKWTLKQNEAYAKYMRSNFDEFSQDGKRIPMYTFNKMSKALDLNKNNKQCRSHHQKMLKKFGNLDNIIKNMIPDERKGERKEENDDGKDYEDSSIVKFIENKGEDLKQKDEISSVDLIQVNENEVRNKEYGIWFDFICQKFNFL